MSNSDSRSGPPPVEPLSARELEVLSHLAENRSNPEIAARLVLSLNTVKWYALQIYRKLGVHSRRQAVSRAAELGLLGTAGRTPGRRHNLPAPLTRFVGRRQEVARVVESMSEPDRRILTLVGPGGIGKTRLALQVAEELVPQHRDGVWLVQLADLSDPALVPQVVATQLGVREQADRSLLETLAARLGRRQLLLVLDNCEHLRHACALLAHALLTAGPDLRILVTSRAPLHVAGEMTWRVPPLSLPAETERPSAEALSGSEAVRLFVERAEAAVPAFAVTTENGPFIAQICHRLEGIPLAIELAAPWVKVLSVAQIAGRLEDRLRLLVAEGDAHPTRQQTLRATLDWSHDLLSDKERLLFWRMAVFAGGFGLEAVEAVCSGDDGEVADILGHLASLVDQSLVMVDRVSGQEHRYRLLDTVRQYALERLRVSGEEERWADAHLAWCLGLAEQDAPYLWGAAEPASLARLELERDNIRAALQWSLEKGRTEQGLRLAAGLAGYWYVRAHLSEGRRWLELALAAGGHASSFSRAAAASAAGTLAVQQGDQEHAVALLEQAISLWRESHTPQGAGWSVLSLGLLALYAGDYARARSLLDESCALFGALDDRAGTATALLYQGLTACHQGDHAGASQLLQQCLPSLRELGDTVGVARALHGLGLAAHHQGDLTHARALFGEALQLAAEKESRLEIADCLEGLAGVAVVQGRPVRAARLLGAAEALREEIGVGRPRGTSTGAMRDIAAVRAQLGPQAFESAWETGSSWTPAQVTAAAQPEAEGPSPGSGIQSPTPPGVAKRRVGGLTARQRQVAVLVAQGSSNATIAAELVVTVRTVETHITHILRKLGFSSRAQIAAWAVNNGLASPPRTLQEQMDGLDDPKPR